MTVAPGAYIRLAAGGAAPTSKFMSVGPAERGVGISTRLRASEHVHSFAFLCFSDGMGIGSNQGSTPVQCMAFIPTTTMRYTNDSDVCLLFTFSRPRGECWPVSRARSPWRGLLRLSRSARSRKLDQARDSEQYHGQKANPSRDSNISRVVRQGACRTSPQRPAQPPAEHV